MALHYEIVASAVFCVASEDLCQSHGEHHNTENVVILEW